MEAMSSVKTHMSAFQSEFKVLGIAAFAGIFTWTFIRALQLHLFSPLIRAYILRSNVEDPRMDVKLRGGQTLMFSMLVPELISYIILMLVLYGVWALNRAMSQ